MSIMITITNKQKKNLNHKVTKKKIVGKKKHRNMNYY